MMNSESCLLFIAFRRSYGHNISGACVCVTPIYSARRSTPFLICGFIGRGHGGGRSITDGNRSEATSPYEKYLVGKYVLYTSICRGFGSFRRHA